MNQPETLQEKNNLISRLAVRTADHLANCRSINHCFLRTPQEETVPQQENDT